MEIVAGVTSKVSVARKILFAIAHVPEGTPNRWEIVKKFAFGEDVPNSVSSVDVKVMAENLQFMDSDVLTTGKKLKQQLLTLVGTVVRSVLC